MKFLVVFLTLMTASVWAVAIPAPEPQPAVEKPKEGEFVAKRPPAPYQTRMTPLGRTANIVSNSSIDFTGIGHFSLVIERVDSTLIGDCVYLEGNRVKWNCMENLKP
ncbi:hypothetical protein GX51_05354 [Blastomyces parvus]|uniref:Uncharacterized protein n=1 Tax=Blastomyces parvus TaxID=2060905 RepID=A0A2B7WXI4_9EURO|nr:hypothetical protein GX51_05354 [Blastomyces parvus]